MARRSAAPGPGEPAFFEGVDDVGDRAGGDPQVLGELAGADGAVVGDDAQGPGLVRREVVRLEGGHPGVAQVAGDAQHEVAEVELGGGAVVVVVAHAGNATGHCCVCLIVR